MPLLNDSSLFVSTAKSYENLCLVSFSFCFRDYFAVEGTSYNCIDVSICIYLAWWIFESVVRSFTSNFDEVVETLDEGFDYIV